MPDRDYPDGTIAWHDLTVDDVPAIRDFYRDVAGWTPEPVDMGDWEDWNMVPPGGRPAAGICHRRGPNSDLPAQWLLYIVVPDLDAALAACADRGGELVSGPHGAGDARYAVIRDPAGAVCALYQT